MSSFCGTKNFVTRQRIAIISMSIHCGSPTDHRVENLLLMKSPVSTLVLCLLYLIAVVGVGPALMKNRKPYNLQKTITLYNAVQVFCSGYVFYEEMWIMYLYFLSKFAEFADTVFFILRKKSSQVTFLHVYHHVSMPLYIWMATKFYPGGSLTVIAFTNSFVHVVMYSYYLLAGLGPHMQKYLWWKKYLTVMQLIQFVTGTVHFIIVLFSGSDCNITKHFIIGYIAIGVFFYILFSSFYKKSYKKTDEITNKPSKNELLKNENIVSSNNNNKIK